MSLNLNRTFRIALQNQSHLIQNRFGLLLQIRTARIKKQGTFQGKLDKLCGKLHLHLIRHIPLVNRLLDLLSKRFRLFHLGFLKLLFCRSSAVSHILRDNLSVIHLTCTVYKFIQLIELADTVTDQHTIPDRLRPSFKNRKHLVKGSYHLFLLHLINRRHRKK